MPTLEVRFICLFSRLILAQPPFVVREPKAAPIPERFNNREIKKGNLSYLAMIERCATVNAKQERKHSNK
jgi:hypothetical protein